MQLFYSQTISDNIIELSEEETRHCIKVLRYNVGNIISVIDGKGNLYKAEIETIKTNKISAKIKELVHQEKEHNYNLHLVIAPTKNIERTELIIEKAIEIGVDIISPIICDRSERKTINIERFNKIAIAAIKQSYKTKLPLINPLISFNNFIKQVDNSDQKFIAHCKTDASKSFLSNQIIKNSSYTLLIGPEGDFSEEEINKAQRSGYFSVSLSKYRLRTETAAILAVSIISSENFK